MIYVASPYSDPNPLVREQRYLLACRFVAHHQRQGTPVFSPIVHSHPLVELCGLPPNDWEFWRKIADAYLKVANTLWIVKLPGWRESVGVTYEHERAIRRLMPVEYHEPIEVGP